MKVIYRRVRDGKTVETLDVAEMEIMEYDDGSLRLSLDFKQKHGLTGVSIPILLNVKDTTTEKTIYEESRAD